MKPQNILVGTTLFLWLTIGAYFISYQLLITKLPPDVIALYTNNPYHLFSQILCGAFIATLAITSYGIWKEKSYAGRGTALAIILLTASMAVLGLHGTYMRIDGIDDFSEYILGALLGLTLSKSINLGTVSKLRLLTIACIFLMILCVTLTFIFDPHRDMRNNFPDSVVRIIAASFFISQLALIFNAKFSKYLFVASTILSLFVSPLQPLAGNSLTSAVEVIWITCLGLTSVACLFSLANDIRPLIGKNNIFRTIILSFYSKPFYREVAYNKTGSCILTFLFLFICWQGILITKASNQDPLMSVVNAIKNDTTENFHGRVSNLILTMEQPTPIIIKDTLGAPVAIIDTSGKYQHLSDTPATVKVLMAKDHWECYYKFPYNTILLKNTYAHFDNDGAVISKLSLVNKIDAMIDIKYLMVYAPIFILSSFIWLITIILLRSYKLRKILPDASARRRISMISIIPALVCVIVLKYLGFQNLGLLIIAAMSLAYRYYIISAL